MKPIRTILIRVSLLAIALGFVLCLGALVAMKFDLTRFNTQETQVVNHTVSESFTHISVDVSDCDVRFVSSHGDTCRVDCPESPNLSYSISVEQGTLTITEQDDTAWYHHVGIDLEPKELVVYLPQQTYGTLKLKTVTGNVSLPQDFSFVDATISTTSGTLQCASAVSGEATMETISGDVDITGWTPQTLQIQSTSADVRLSQVVVANSCRVENVSGDVHLNGCDAQSLVINTVSGDISASLCTGKTFSTQTVSGDVDVPSNFSGGSCNLTTVSGDITCTIQ